MITYNTYRQLNNDEIIKADDEFFSKITGEWLKADRLVGIRINEDMVPFRRKAV